MINLSAIEAQFSQELSALRSIKKPRSRKYSKELKNAIMQLHADGVPLTKIRAGLNLSEHAFAYWLLDKSAKSTRKNAFVPLVFPQKQEEILSSELEADLVVIELRSGIKIRLR